MDTEDQRRHPRYDVFDLEGALVVQVDVTVLNIAPFGMAVRSPVELRPGETYCFKLASNGRFAKLRGSVKWCKQLAVATEDGDSSAPSYAAGLEFDRGQVSRQPVRLLDFIFARPVAKVQRLRYGRFAFQQAPSIVLESSLPCQARTISLSGMMVETTASVPPESKVLLRLELDGCPFSTRSRVAALGTSASTGAREVFEIGLEFLPHYSHQSKALSRFIEQKSGTSDQSPQVH